MMTVNVKYFAAIRDIVGCGESAEEMQPGTTVGDFLETLAVRHGRIGEWKPYLRIAVNRVYVDAGCVIRQGDELAVIPPVSGG
jgi:MoaE-MoaD fusion protein